MSNSSVLQSVISPRPPTTSTVIPFSSSEERSADDQINDIPDLELITSALVENAPVAMAMLDRKMRYVLANRQWIADFGLKDALPLIGRSQFEVFPNLNPGWKNVYERALQGHVVRSEHDVQPAQPGGRPMVFRWEVRPWRRAEDAAVMGIMLTCEKFTGVSLPQTVSDDEATHSSVEAISKSHLPECGVPMVALDASGRVQECNNAMRALLSTPTPEGHASIWEVLAGSVVTEEARTQWTSSLASVTTGLAATITLEPRLFTGPSALLQWTLSQFQRSGEETLVLLMGNATPFAVAAETLPTPAALPVAEATPPLPPPDFLSAPAKVETFPPRSALPDDSLIRELEQMREVETTYQRREQRHREILDTMPCGLIVLDERGRPIFQNAHVRDLVGRELHTGGSVEQWIVSACPDESGREQAAAVWRDDIWRRQITRVLSLITADGLVKDLEFRPSSLPQGGLLLTIHDVTDSCRLEEMLAGVEAKFRTMMRDCPLPLLLTDVKGSIFDTNPEAEALFSRSRNELRRLSLDLLLTSESEERRRAEVARVAASGLSQARLTVQLQANAEEHELCVAVVKGGEGRPHALVNFLKPVHTASVEPVVATTPIPPQPAPVELQSTWETVLTTDEFGRIDSWNEPLGLAHFGLAEPQAIGMHLHRLFRPSDATGFYSSLQQHLSVMAEGPVHWSWFGGEAKRGEDDFMVISREPGTFALELRLQTHPAPLLSELAEPLFADDTAAVPTVTGAAQPRPSAVYVIAPGPAELWSGGDLNRERMLLTETHHRVKNHLQIISSLLNLQSNSVEDESVRTLLRSSQNRVRAIAALHQHLYEMQLGQSLSLTDFAEELVLRLRECFEAPQDRVKVVLNLASPKLHDEWLMPVALILNEALSNAFKHAFPDGRKGTIRVSLSVESDGAHLRVDDDGVGLPQQFGGPGSMGLGLKVLGVFADQLRGQTSLKNIVNAGLSFDLLFPITCVDI